MSTTASFCTALWHAARRNSPISSATRAFRSRSAAMPQIPCRCGACRSPGMPARSTTDPSSTRLPRCGCKSFRNTPPCLRRWRGKMATCVSRRRQSPRGSRFCASHRTSSRCWTTSTASATASSSPFRNAISMCISRPRATPGTRSTTAINVAHARLLRARAQCRPNNLSSSQVSRPPRSCCCGRAGAAPDCAPMP